MPASNEIEGVNERNAALVRRLGAVSFACWLLSLALPGFYVPGRYPLFGAEILLIGPVFGVTVGGWAVYANFFYLWGALRLWRNQPLDVSIYIMLALVATLPLFKGVIQDEGSGNIVAVTSWGWGVAVWLVSIATLALAVALRAGALSRRGLINVGVASSAVLACVGILQWSKWRSANVQERVLYFPRGSLLTPRTMCGIQLTWPHGRLVPEDETLALDVDTELTTRWPGAVELPRIASYVRDGYLWEDYPDFEQKVKVRSAAVSTRFTLQVHREADGAVIRILEAGKAAPIYEQRLRGVKDEFHRETFCPFAEIPNRPSIPGFKAALNLALGIRAEANPKWENADELADQRCDIGDAEIADGSGLHAWDGRDVSLGLDSNTMRWPGFCSEHYAALVNVAPRTPDPEDWGAMVLVFERRTLRQLGDFRDPMVCWPPDSKQCPRVPAEEIHRLRINRSQVQVETSKGTFTAKFAR